jgi:hypothetical protein
MLRIARIDLASGLVVNVEMAAQDWLDAHADDPEFLFVVDAPDLPAHVGLGYDPGTGFEQPA